MKNVKINILFGAVVLVVVLGVLFEDQVRVFLSSSGKFDITEIAFRDISGKGEKLDPSFRGYVVFYSDLIACPMCLLRISNLNGLDKSYPDVGFYAIVKHRGDAKVFAEQMLQSQIPGTYLVDDLQMLQRRLSLDDRPMLLFFNRNRDLIASLPMDTDYENLKKQIHLFLNEY